MTSHYTPEPPTVVGLLQRACQKYNDRTLATFGDDSISYGQAWQRAGALASALSETGIEKGDRIGLLMSNQLEYITADLACIRGGYVKVALNDMLTKDEVEYILSDSGSKAVIVGEDFLDMAANVGGRLPELEETVVLSDDAPEGMVASELLINAHENETPDAEIGPEDLVFTPYTGGTTGKPKGAKYTHGTFAFNLLAHVMELDITPNDRMLLMTPLPHAAGICLLSGMIRGVHTVITEGFDAGEFLTQLETNRITWSWVVPTMIYRVLDHDQLETSDASSLETLVYGGAPIARERLEEALDAFGQVFIQVYGQTEVPTVGTVLPKHDHVVGGGEKLDSCGQPTAMVDARIAPATKKRDTTSVPTGEAGEILLRAPFQMIGYHNLPEKTNNTLVDGWVRTGDIGRMDDDGYLYILDRDKDMVVSGGMNVYTTNVEDVLVEHPGIREVAVIGVPDENWGEAVHAVVVKNPEADVAESAVISFADDRLADYKKPKSVEFADELPTTPYGKVDKKALRGPYWEEKERDVA
jgi:fatty-acyl-CoA synthase/long-chain acyl-CoA synthetase